MKQPFDPYQSYKFYTATMLRIFNEKKYPIVKSRNGNVVFVHINKTAGTSILKALGKTKFHLNVIELNRLLGVKTLNKAVLFTVVRNPFERVRSMYYHRLRVNNNGIVDKNISFKDWVKCCFDEPFDHTFRLGQPKMFETQLSWLKNKEGKVQVDRIIKFENLSEEWAKLATEFGFPSALGKLNQSARSQYSESEMDSETVEIIQRYFKEDFEYFNYTMEYKKNID